KEEDALALKEEIELSREDGVPEEEELALSSDTEEQTAVNAPSGKEYFDLSAAFSDASGDGEDDSEQDFEGEAYPSFDVDELNREEALAASPRDDGSDRDRETAEDSYEEPSGEAQIDPDDEEPLSPADFTPVEFLLCTLEQRSFKKLASEGNPYAN
ncbi:MAG: MSCRAMM family adhesin SdrC, partial [Deltaproteobacteria bacterium]|nr:MSCRAMM family adhesin SdrC [Deltaproteobacteria bacterium]